MKCKVATIAILVLAFLVKDIITLVLATSAMASGERSAIRLVNIVLPSEDTSRASGYYAPPPPIAAQPAPARSQRVREGGASAGGPRRCHILPLPGQQTPVSQFNSALLRITTLSVSDMSGFDAILVGIVILSIASAAAFQHGTRRCLFGIMPELLIPPG